MRKSHGYKGQVKVVVHGDFEDELTEGQFIFLETEGYKVPFQIQEIDDYKDTVLKLAYINSPEDLRPFLKAVLYVISDEKLILEKSQDEHVRFAGYSIIDEDKGFVGLIDRVESYPQQEMAIVIVDDKEILIPLHEDLILEVNESNKKLVMSLPEGLLG